MDEPPADPEDRIDEEDVLTPDDLDIEDADEVEPVGENRYVVSTGASDDSLSPTERGANRPGSAETDATGRTDRENIPADQERVGQYGEGAPGPDVGGPTPLGALPQRYAIDVQVKTDAGVDGTRIASEDVVAAFEELLVWYATQLDGDTPPEEVLEILLAESSIES